MRRVAMLLAVVMTVTACGHPLVPASALRPARTPATPNRRTRPILGVDLYAPSNYPATEVRADGNRMLAYIKNVLKANAVGIVWNFYATSQNSDAVERTDNTLSARKVGIMTRIAKRDHLLVEYRPLIFVSNKPANPWEGLIHPGDPARWLRSYYRTELPYLRMAQHRRVSEFVTATDMADLGSRPLWPSFFARVSRVYHGVTSYAAWDKDYLPPREHILPVKYLGMDMYTKLRLPATATSAQVTAAMERKFRRIPASVLRRTAIDETGIEARAGAYQDPHHLGSPGRLNERVQANWYIAVCRTVQRYQMRGVFFWKADLIDNRAHPAKALSTFERRKGAKAISECAQILH